MGLYLANAGGEPEGNPLVSATAEPSTGVFPLSYETTQKGLTIGDHKLVVAYTGNTNQSGYSEDINITLKQYVIDHIGASHDDYDRKYDGTTLIQMGQINFSTVDYDDDVKLDMTKLHANVSSPDVGTYEYVTLTNAEDAGKSLVLTGDDAAYYTMPGREVKLSMPVTIDKATFYAPNVTGTYAVDEAAQTYTYTINVIDGAMYCMDDNDWQVGNVFKGIQPGSTHTFYAYYPETDNYYASEEGSIEVTFPKLQGQGSVTIEGWTYGNTPNQPVSTSTTGNAVLSTIYHKQGDPSAVILPESAGNYSVVVTFGETATHSGFTASCDFVIAKADPISSVPGSFAATYGDTLGDHPLLNGWTWVDPADTSVGPVGDNTFKAVYEPDDTSNYNTLYADVIITVYPLTITPTMTPIADMTFNGTALEPAVELTFGDPAQVLAPEEYTVTYVNNINSGYAYVLLASAAGSNYIFGNFGGGFVINKAPAPEMADITVAYSGLTPTIGASVQVPAPADNCGPISYSRTINAAAETYLRNVSVDSNGKLTFDTVATDETAECIITVTMTSQNYEDTVQDVIVRLTERTVLEITGVEAQTGLVYNGQSQTGYTGTPVPVPALDGFESLGGTISYAGTQADGTAYGPTADKPVNAGDYTVSFTIDTPVCEGSLTLAFSIAKAVPTGTPGYTAITGSGKTLADAALTAEGKFSTAGSIAWKLPATTVVECGAAYEWVFTPADTTNYQSISGKITPWTTAETVSITGVEAQTGLVYNGQPQTGYTGTPVPVPALDGFESLGGTITYAGTQVDGTAYGPTADKPVNAGDYTVSFIIDTPDCEGSLTLAFSIAKAVPTGTPGYTAITGSGKTLADAALTAEGKFSTAGTVVWTLPATTVVECGAAYEWVFTPADTTNYQSISGKITPWTTGELPVITSPTADQIVAAYVGDKATLTITAKGAETYQWYVDRQDGKGFVTITGANKPSYTTSAVILANNGYVYYCEAANDYGEAVSPEFTLSVTEKAVLPETGDDANLGPWCALLMISLACMAWTILNDRKRREH